MTEVNPNKLTREFERMMGKSYENLMNSSYSSQSSMVDKGSKGIEILGKYYLSNGRLSGELLLLTEAGKISFYNYKTSDYCTHPFSLDIESKKYVFPKEIKDVVLNSPDLVNETADYFV